ncbi:MAG: hypothetical protein Ct9H300mP11_30110 [Chloroflexota bacterium]|nr:MAG: hypothetical protein Ct9H300mP11_30110 [Chloroflexota bacterium]
MTERRIAPLSVTRVPWSCLLVAWAILNKVPPPRKGPDLQPHGHVTVVETAGTEMAGQFAKLKIRVNRNLRRDEDSLLVIGGSSILVGLPYLRLAALTHRID